MSLVRHLGALHLQYELSRASVIKNHAESIKVHNQIDIRSLRNADLTRKLDLIVKIVPQWATAVNIGSCQSVLIGKSEESVLVLRGSYSESETGVLSKHSQW